MPLSGALRGVHKGDVGLLFSTIARFQRAMKLLVPRLASVSDSLQEPKLQAKLPAKRCSKRSKPERAELDRRRSRTQHGRHRCGQQYTRYPLYRQLLRAFLGAMLSTKPRRICSSNRCRVCCAEESPTPTCLPAHEIAHAEYAMRSCNRSYMYRHDICSYGHCLELPPW